MKSNVEKVSSLGRKLNVQIPAEIVSSVFDNALKGVQKQAKIKGFRPGKAPLTTIRLMYGDNVKQDVTQDLIQKHYYKAILEHSLDPVTYPEFEFDHIQEDKEFSFTASFEVKPEITLKKYEGLEVKKEKAEISDARIQQVIDNIRASRAEVVPVLEDRPAQLGDIAVIDFVGRVNGELLQGGAGTDHQLELGTQQFIEGFEEGVVGMTVGSTKTLSLTFPSPYQSEELAGKPVSFEVTLKSLKKKSLPEFNDEFVSQMMNAENDGTHTVEKMRQTILDDIQRSETKRIDGDLKNRLLKALIVANPIEVPDGLVQEQKQALIEDMQKRMSEQGVPPTEFEAYKQKWDADFASTARDMIQSGFLIDAIAKKHDLNWSEADLEQKIQEYSRQTGLDPEKIREFYSRPEQQNRVTYMITEEKVIAFLLSSAKVSEVSKDQLN